MGELLLTGGSVGLDVLHPGCVVAHHMGMLKTGKQFHLPQDLKQRQEDRRLNKI